MHLLAASWGLDDHEIERVRSSLAGVARAYPQLDPATAWHESAGRAFAAGVHHPVRAIVPRRYVARRPGEVVTYDGLVYDRRRDFDAREAAQLATRWDELPERLEGQLAALRITRTSLEVLTDPLGLQQLYVTRLGCGWVLSTSARLLAGLAGSTGLDHTAAGLFVAMGCIGGQRTWHPGVEVVGGGQRWRWDGDDDEPRRETYYSVRQLLHRPRRRSVDLAALADGMAEGPLDLAPDFAPFEAALTGGRDSRVVAGLLLRAGLPARYYTFGGDDAADVVVARAVAARLALDHEVREEGGGVVPERWQEGSARLVLQNDGLVSLRHIATAIDQPAAVPDLPIRLWGAGGGVGKGNWTSARMFLPGQGTSEVLSQMVRRLTHHHGGLVRPEAHAVARAHLEGYVTTAVDHGVPLHDVPGLYSSEERTRRFDYNIARSFRPVLDVLSPFATRSFVEASFALSALRRHSSPLHHGLSRTLVPGLHQIPYDSPWPSQRPGLNLLGGVAARAARRGRRAAGPAAPGWRQQLRAPWLEARRQDVRALCLDQAGSTLWDVADRATFERLMADDADPRLRLRHQDGLFDLATGFSYDDARRPGSQIAAGRPPRLLVRRQPSGVAPDVPTVPLE